MLQSCYMSPQGETEVVLEKPKRTPRKRAPKADLSDNATTAPIKRVPQKRVVKRVVEESRPERSSSRKAPTPIAAEKAKTRRGRKNVTVVAILLLLGIGSSAAVGFTDKGQIDVAQTIAQRNEAARAAGQPEITIPVQTTVEPNGGLTGVGDDPNAQPPVSAPDSSSASSTEATASTTEEAASQETASTT
jgi:hypothetical protein